GIPILLTEAQVKLQGEIWIVHKNDADPFPSNPHAHNYRERLKYRKRYLVPLRLCFNIYHFLRTRSHSKRLRHRFAPTAKVDSGRCMTRSLSAVPRWTPPRLMKRP